MIDAPQIDRPWRASTAAGAPLEMHAPLHQLKLFDGAFITFHPEEPPTPPVVRDAAESLTAAAAGARETRGLDLAAGVVGACAIAALVSKAAPLPMAIFAGAALLLVTAVLRASGMLFLLATAGVSAAVGAWVAGPPRQWFGGTDVALGALGASATAAAAIAAGASVGLAAPAGVAAVLTCAVLTATGAIGAWLPGALAPAALTVLGGVCLVAATPRLATRAAGLEIPRIPTAGEEFSSADGYQADVDARSERAVALAAAISCAVAGCAIPALVACAWRGGGWAFAFSLATAGAFGLHTLRHHYPLPRLALGAVTLAGIAGCVLAVVRTPGAHPAMVAVAAVAAACAADTPLWLPRLPKLEPTTVVWFERAEAAAIIAVIPLAVQLTGVFAAIRGL